MPASALLGAGAAFQRCFHMTARTDNNIPVLYLFLTF